ncbi:S-adenosyl-L-methionine-dependent methyltransferase [Zopfochytrium polystomum]|nr:S-adenosyl-L-methionine-dependent methyltransferase [Zopfochytrium polystomum]
MADFGITNANLSDYTSVAVGRARADEADRLDRILNVPFARHVSSLPRHDHPGIPHNPVRQVVLLGADLDSRAYRLPRLAGCNAYEIEGSPAIAAHKARRLAGAEPLTVAFHTVVADVAGLADAWTRELAARRFDEGLPTLWVAEGLLPYLTQYAEDQFLAAVDRLSPAGSCMLADAWGGGRSDAGRFELDALKAVPRRRRRPPPMRPLRHRRAITFARWRTGGPRRCC